MKLIGRALQRTGNLSPSPEAGERPIRRSRGRIRKNLLSVLLQVCVDETLRCEVHGQLCRQVGYRFCNVTCCYCTTAHGSNHRSPYRRCAHYSCSVGFSPKRMTDKVFSRILASNKNDTLST